MRCPKHSALNDGTSELRGGGIAAFACRWCDLFCPAGSINEIGVSSNVIRYKEFTPDVLLPSSLSAIAYVRTKRCMTGIACNPRNSALLLVAFMLRFGWLKRAILRHVFGEVLRLIAQLSLSKNPASA